MPEASEVITVRVPRGTKSAMKRAKINLSEDIRNYLEARLMSFELYGLLPGIYRRASKRRVNLDSADVIRYYRDAR